MKNKILAFVFASAMLLPVQSQTIIRDNDRPTRQVVNRLINFNTTVFAGVKETIDIPANKVLVIEQIGCTAILPALDNPGGALQVNVKGAIAVQISRA